MSRSRARVCVSVCVYLCENAAMITMHRGDQGDGFEKKFKCQLENLAH